MRNRAARGDISKPGVDRLAHVQLVNHVVPRGVVGKAIDGFASMSFCVQ